MIDDDFFLFTIQHSELTKKLRHADSVVIIALKARAYLNQAQINRSLGFLYVVRQQEILMNNLGLRLSKQPHTKAQYRRHKSGLGVKPVDGDIPHPTNTL